MAYLVYIKLDIHYTYLYRKNRSVGPRIPPCKMDTQRIHIHSVPYRENHARTQALEWGRQLAESVAREPQITLAY
jgi:hypothetical protein